MRHPIEIRLKDRNRIGVVALQQRQQTKMKLDLGEMSLRAR
jgi:hypothetical protein